MGLNAKEMEEKSDRELMLELLEVTDIQPDGAVEFSRYAKKLIETLAKRHGKASNIPEWLKQAEAPAVYRHLCKKITQAPTSILVMMAGETLIPILHEKLTKEGKERCPELTEL